MGEGDDRTVCEEDRRMTETVPAPTRSVSKPSARRTRVKLRRVNSDFSKPYPSYRQILVTAGPVRRRRLWADGRSAWR
jgi:hypothetical protein